MSENQQVKSINQQSQFAKNAQSKEKAQNNKTKNGNKHKHSQLIIDKDPITPIEQRECTDIYCLITFLSLVAVIFLIAIYAWSAGNFKKMTTAYDPDGKGCGTDYIDYPYIYFASPHADSLWVTTCVSKCPVSTDLILSCKTNSVVKKCSAVKDSNNTKSVQIYDTIVTANTACLPTSNKIKNQIAAAFGGSADSMSSLIKNYAIILFSFPIAILIAVAFMLLIRFTAKLFIYMVIIFAITALLAIGVYLVASTAPTSSTIIIAIVCFVFAFIIILAVFCIRRRLSLASIIIKVSANFVSSNFYIVLFPIALFIVTVLYLALWVVQTLGFYSLGVPTTSEHQYPFQHFTITTSIQVLFVFHIVHLIWVLLFLIQTSNFIVGGTASGWYFKRQHPFSQASERYLKKHIGSVCFGSLMLALLGFVRIVYNIMVPKRQSEGLANIFKKFCDFFCCVCNKLFQWFTVGAFTIISIRGTPYFSSGSEAVYLKIKSINTSSVVSLVQGVFNFLVCLGIIFTTVFIIDLLIKNLAAFHENVQDSSLILLVVGFVAFTISCFFISVYSDAIDAIYISYLVDKERRDTETPSDLKQFLDQAQKEK